MIGFGFSEYLNVEFKRQAEETVVIGAPCPPDELNQGVFRSNGSNCTGCWLSVR